MGGTTVLDSLTSTSTSSALSANQGRVLNEKIEALETRVETLENNSSGSESGSQCDCELRIWTEPVA